MCSNQFPSSDINQYVFYSLGTIGWHQLTKDLIPLALRFQQTDHENGNNHLRKEVTHVYQDNIVQSAHQTLEGEISTHFLEVK